LLREQFVTAKKSFVFQNDAAPPAGKQHAAQGLRKTRAICGYIPARSRKPFIHMAATGCIRAVSIA
jgi:hypothetical protein